MNESHYHNGVRYILIASTRENWNKEPKHIETPLVAEMDANYLKLRALMDKADNDK